MGIKAAKHYVSPCMQHDQSQYLRLALRAIEPAGRRFVMRIGLYAGIAVLAVLFSSMPAWGNDEVSSRSQAFQIATPEDNGRIFFQLGAQSVPLSIAVDAFAPLPPGVLEFSVDDNATVPIPGLPPAAEFADLTLLAEQVQHRIAAELRVMDAAEALYADSAMFEVVQVDADSNQDGFLDDPFALALTECDLWRASGGSVAAPVRDVVMAGLSASRSARGGLLLAVQLHLADKARAWLRAPSGLLDTGEQGVVVFAGASSPEALPGAEPPASPYFTLMSDGPYVYVDVLVSADGGRTFQSIDPARLAVNPLLLRMEGLHPPAGQDIRFAQIKTIAEDADAGPGVMFHARLDAVSTWALSAKGSRMDGNAIEGLLSEAGLITLAQARDTLRIRSVVNPASGDASDFCIGGGVVRIVLEHAPAGASIQAAIDGQAAEVVKVENGPTATCLVRTPRAKPLAVPQQERLVDVQVWDGNAPNNTDTLANGFRYKAPRLDGVTPGAGPAQGGTPIEVRGEGFDMKGISARLGSAPLLDARNATGQGIQWVTPEGAAGPVSLGIITENGFLAVLPNAFQYQPCAPEPQTVWPESVPIPGGYTIRMYMKASESAPLNQNVAVYFARDPEHPEPSRDIRAESVSVLGTTMLYARTPEVEHPFQSAVYLALEQGNEAACAVSKALPFSFQAAADMQVEHVQPKEGPMSGGGVVRITVRGITYAENEPPPRVWIGACEAVVQHATPSSGSWFFLDVMAPAGEHPNVASDVRVMNASGEYAVLPEAYMYKNDGTPYLLGIEPNCAWVFGGAVLHITGKFLQAANGQRPQVFIGGSEAHYPPDDENFASSAEELHILAPPYTGEFLPGQDRVAAPVRVVGADGKAFECADTFEYVRQQRRVDTAPGGGAVASVQGEVSAAALYCRTMDEPQEFRMPLGEGQNVEAALLRIPASSGFRHTDCGILVRATRTPRLFGLDALDAGRECDGLWAFDIHFYETAYPFEEIWPFPFLPGKTPIELLVPVPYTDNGSLLQASELQSGGISCFRLETALAYMPSSYAHMKIKTDPAGRPRSTYEWNISGGDVLPQLSPASPPGSRMEVVRMPLSGPGAVALRRDAWPPESLLRAARYTLSANGDKRGAYEGGAVVAIEGRGLAWPERIFFGDILAYERGKKLDERLLMSSDTMLKVKAPAAEQRERNTPVPLAIELPQGNQGSTVKITVSEPFTYVALSPPAHLRLWIYAVVSSIAAATALVGIGGLVFWRKKCRSNGAHERK